MVGSGSSVFLLGLGKLKLASNVTDSQSQSPQALCAQGTAPQHLLLDNINHHEKFGVAGSGSSGSFGTCEAQIWKQRD